MSPVERRHLLPKPNLPVRYSPDLSAPEPVCCTFKPECKDCPYPAHGFQCYNPRTGECMWNRAVKR